MAFAIHCFCGQRLEVTEGMASTSVQCPCGRTLTVPSLGELRQLYPQTEEPPDHSERNQAIARVVLIGLGAMVLGTIAAVVGIAVVAVGGGLPTIGYGIFLFGYIWLLLQIAQVCPPSALVMVVVVPFFHWYYAFQRWDIAKWPFLCNVGGLVLLLIGLTRRAS
jgi:hypothetical protein